MVIEMAVVYYTCINTMVHGYRCFTALLQAKTCIHHLKLVANGNEHIMLAW